jgi:uncharacterized protein (DUF58 family)
MLRPSRRLLLLSLAALAAGTLAIAVPGAPPAVGVAIWLAVLAAMLADLAVSPAGRGVMARAEAPYEVFTGESATLMFHVGFPGSQPPQGIRARIAIPEGLGGSRDVVLAPDGQGAAGAAVLAGIRRGSYAFDHIWLSWPSRLGLFEIAPTPAVDARIDVVPNIRPVSSGKIDVDVKSELYGVKDNAIRGEGSEFHQLRDFTTGKDTRAIDWKRSARRRGLVAKEMRAERNHQVILCLDNGYLMREEIAGLPKIDHALNAGLALTWAAGIGGDLAGFYSFDARPRTYLPPQPGRAAFARLRHHAAGLSYSTVDSNHTLAMTHLNGLLKRRSLIVVFSDFVDTTTAELMVENIAVLNRRHVLVFVALRDPVLDDRAARAITTMEGVARAVAIGQLARERQAVLDRLSRIGVLVIDTLPANLTARLISTYLMIKSRELI